MRWWRCYPHRDQVPAEAWLRLFGSAAREVGILALDGTYLAQVPGVLVMLGERADAGVRVRICLGDPGGPGAGGGVSDEDSGSLTAGGEGAVADARGALRMYGPLRSCGVQIRLHHGDLYGDLCFGDDQMGRIEDQPPVRRRPGQLAPPD